MVGKRSIWIIGLLLISLAGCATSQAAPTATPLPTAAPVTEMPPTAIPSPTMAPPTPSPVPTNTPIPVTEAPTPDDVIPEDLTPAETTTGEAPSDAETPTGEAPGGISITPQLGEPEDIIIVRGEGFEPGTAVTLHWAELEGETGPEYYALEADEDGDFEVGLIVPSADEWPGGEPEPEDNIQLRALADELADGYYFANFKYLPATAGSGLALTYTNEPFGYALTVPSGWTWSWASDDASNVRFESEDGSGYGFSRVLEDIDVESAIIQVMPEEFPDNDYTAGQMSVGTYPGTQVTLDDGRVVQFIPGEERVYVLSFVNDAGNPALNVLDTFELR